VVARGVEQANGLGEARRVLMVFVDGFGLGVDDPVVNPICPAVCPALCRLLARHAHAIDAQLGVPGLPQSATGQAALLTGRNAAEAMGRHIEGFPGPALRDFIEEGTLFTACRDAGIPATFANGYYAETLEQVHAARRKSVTTVSALSGVGYVRLLDAIKRRRAVYHDMTREHLRERGYVGPLLTEAEAAEDLVSLARDHRFTLFEHFQTDHAGHAGDRARAEATLQRLDRFMDALVPLALQHGITVVMTSDHGNIEELRYSTHTSNPVPFMVVGAGAAEMRGSVSGLCDVAPAVMRYLCG
jgi:2,3-bisphosphoglycerate-independent phosphoglycerate mutase